MEVRPPRRAQITGIQAGGTQAPLCLALGLSRPLRLRVSCLCCPAAAQGALNTPDTFQLADLSSCSLTHENPSSSRSSAVDGEVKVTLGMVRGGSHVIAMVTDLEQFSLYPKTLSPLSAHQGPSAAEETGGTFINCLN